MVGLLDNLRRGKANLAPGEFEKSDKSSDLNYTEFDMLAGGGANAHVRATSVHTSSARRTCLNKGTALEETILSLSGW